MKQNGNALFLILIAVALFAALSYAVTQSGRGGGSIDREQIAIDAASAIQFASSVEQQITKNSLLRTYDQLLFDDGAFNASGTTYPPDGTTPTGSSIGIFNQEVGLTPIVPPENLFFTISAASSLFLI